MERIDSVVKKSGGDGTIDKLSKKFSGSALGKLINKTKTIKNIEYIVAAVFIGIILLITFSGNIFTAKKQSSTVTFTLAEYGKAVETKLENVLSSISGAGKVKVMVTFENGIELITAEVVNKQSNTVKDEYSGGFRETVSMTEQNSPVMVGGKPVILKEIEPQVKGVIVVAEGAGNLKVKLELLKAVSTLLKVKQDYIEVFTMAKK